jgi:hypothetical protein
MWPELGAFTGTEIGPIIAALGWPAVVLIAVLVVSLLVFLCWVLRTNERTRNLLRIIRAALKTDSVKERPAVEPAHLPAVRKQKKKSSSG